MPASLQLLFSEWAPPLASALLDPKLLSGAKGRGVIQFWFTFFSRRGSQPTWEGSALCLPSLDWSSAFTSVLLPLKAPRLKPKWVVSVNTFRTEVALVLLSCRLLLWGDIFSSDLACCFPTIFLALQLNFFFLTQHFKLCSEVKRSLPLLKTKISRSVSDLLCWGGLRGRFVLGCIGENLLFIRMSVSARIQPTSCLHCSVPWPGC